jgi:filamentous hemagglutinin family protein
MDAKKLSLKIGLILCVLSLFVLTPTSHGLFCLPEPEKVVSGQAEFLYPDSTTLEINASDKAIINYKSFDILENESVIVRLPAVSNEILNRVIRNNASELLGRLSCNGIFLLINESGIYIGPRASIEAAGLVLSTRDILDADFLSGKYFFKKLSKDELDYLLLNEGTLKVASGGYAALIAGAIENKGAIIAPLGTIALAGGNAVTLGISDDGLISIAIDEPVAQTVLDYQGRPVTEQIKNTGNLEADGGVVILKAESIPGIFEKAINLDGYVKAEKLIVEGKTIIAKAGTAKEIEIYKKDNLSLTSSMLEDNLITLEGQDFKLIYIQTANLTLQTDNSINTTPGIIIQANQVKLIAKQFGTLEVPLHIDANLTYINRTGGVIEIMESTGLGTSIMLRGPPDGFGAIIYNRNTNLTLDAEKILVGGVDFIRLYGDITFYNFECTIPDAELYFEAGKTYTFKGSLTILGSPDIGPEEYLIKLRSQEPGQPYYLEILADNYTLNLLNISDCYAKEPLYIPVGVDAGNNRNLEIDPTWDGGGLTNNWSEGDNWVGNAVPNTNQAITFNVTSTKDCTIDNVGAWSGGNFTIESGYTGIITLSTDIVVGSYSQAGGTFNASSRTLTCRGNFTHTAGGTFNAGTGSVVFSYNSKTVDVATTETFNNLTVNLLNDSYSLTIASGDTLIVNGTTTLTNGNVNTGTLNAKGLISVAATFDGGSAILLIDGSINQSFTIPDGAYLPGITLNNALTTIDFAVGATAYIENTFTLQAGTFTASSGTTVFYWYFTHTAGGTFNHNSGTVRFYGNGITSIVDVNGTETFNNLTVDLYWEDYNLTIASGDTLIVNGTTTLTKGIINGSILNAKGPISVASTYNGGVGNGTLLIDGSGDQSFTIPDGATLPKITLDNANTTINFAVGATAYMSSLTLQNGTFTASNGTTNFAYTFTHTAGGTFNHNNGTVRFYNGGITTTVDVNGTETFNNLTVDLISTNYYLAIASGDTLIVNGTATLTYGHLTGTLNAKGDLIVESTWVGGNANYIISGTGAQTITGTTTSFTSGQVTIANTGVASLGSNTTITKLTINSGGTFDLAGYSFTSSNFIVNGTLRLRGDEIFTIPTLQAGSTVIYYGPGVYPSLVAGNNYYNLTFNGIGGAWDLSTNALAVTHALSIINGTLDLNGQNLTATGASFSNTGTLRLKGNETLTDLTMDTDSGTVEYDGTSPYVGLKAGNNYYNLTFNGSGSWALTTACDVNGNFYLDSGSFSHNGKNLNVAGNFTLDAGTTYTKGGILTFDGTTIFTDNGTHNIGIVVVGSSPDSVSLASDFTADFLTINAADTFTTNGYDVTLTDFLTINAGGILNASSGAGGDTIITLAGNWSNSGIFTAGSSTVTFTATDTDNTINPGMSSFYNLTLNGVGGAWDLSTNALAVTHALSIINGTLDLNGKNLTATGANFSNDATLRLKGSETVTGLTMDTDTGTVVYDGTAPYPNLAAGSNYYNLTFNGVGGGWTLGANTYIYANLTISNGTLNASTNGYTINLWGNWFNAATFTAGNSRVTFRSPGTQNVTSGGSSFYNIRMMNTGSVVLQDALDVDNDIAHTSIGTLDSNNQNITVGHDWSIFVLGTFIAGSGTVTFDGADATITTGGTGAGKSFNNVTLDSTGTKTLAGDINIDGNFTISGGAFDVSTSNYAMYVAGNWFNSGGFTARNGSVTFDGSSGTQTLASGGIASEKQFYNITINNSGTSVLLIQDLVQSAGGVLSFTQGTLELNGKTLYLGANFNPAPTSGAVLDLSAGGTLSGANYNITLANSNMTITGLGTITCQDYSHSLGTHMLYGTLNTRDFSHTGGTFTCVGTTYINASGNVVITAPWTSFGNTVKMTGGAKTINASQPVYNLTIADGASVSILTNNLSVGGTLGVGQGASGLLDTNSKNLTVTGTTAIGNGATFNLDGTSSSSTLSISNTLTNNGTFVLEDDTNTLSIVGSGARRTFTGNDIDYNTNSITLTNIDYDPDVSLDEAGDTIVLDDANCLFDAISIGVGGVASSFNAGGYDFTLSGNFTNTANGTFTSTGTATFDGSSNQTLTAGGTDASHDFQNIIHIGSANLILGGNIDIDGTLTQNNAASDIDPSASNYTITAGNLTLTSGTINNSSRTGTWDINGNVTISAGTFKAPTTLYAAGDWSNSGTFTAGTGTVIFDGGSATINTGGTGAGKLFNNVTINSSGTKTLVDNHIDIDGNFSILAGTFDVSASNYTMYVAGNWDNNGTFNARSGTVTFDGTGAQIIYSGGYTDNQDFNNLTISNTAGTVTVSNEHLKVGGTLQVNASTSFTLADNSQIWVTGTLTLNATPSYASASCVLYENGATYDYYGGTSGINKSSLIYDFANTDNVRIRRGKLPQDELAEALSLTIDNGTTYAMNAGNLDVDTGGITINGTLEGANTIYNAGNWNNSGTFTAGTSTVTFDGTDQSIIGSTTFYNFSRPHASSLSFEAGSTQAIEGKLTLKGAAADLLLLRSSIPGVQWHINPKSEIDVSFVDVKDSFNDNLIYIDPPNSLDSGNNAYWFTPKKEEEEKIEPPENILPPVPEPPTEPVVPVSGENVQMPEAAPVNTAESEYFCIGKGSYQKCYPVGKYKTVVIVFEGKVVVVPYDEKGPRYEEEMLILPGQRITKEQEVGENE